MENVVAIIQARMGSSRLPGKVLMPAAGRPLLAHLVQRLSYCRMINKIVIATSVNPGDRPIVELAEQLQVDNFRGSEQDCLGRYANAAIESGADFVVRITSDCPLLDPQLVDNFVSFALATKGQWDLITNRHPLTFVDGLDVDVIPIASLLEAFQNAIEPHQREHTIPYFWDTGRRVHNITDPDELFYTYRWTLDYFEDYQVIKCIYDALYPKNPNFGTRDILKFLSSRPELIQANQRYIPRKQPVVEIGSQD